MRLDDEIVDALAHAPLSDFERMGRQEGLYWTANELMRAEFPPARWAVPGLVAEGLNLLVGSPKLGKSWFCLGLGIAIASGGRALGKVAVDQGEVLYAALEDTPRRLRDRLNLSLGHVEPPSGLHLSTTMPRLPDAGPVLDDWLQDHPDCRLVIIDVLRKIRPVNGSHNAYDADYDTLGELKALADRRGVSFLVVHHSRKLADENDVFNEVAGSTGLTGAADAILYAKRSRNTSDAVLHVTGRDICEREYSMSWDAESFAWTLADEPEAVSGMRPTRRRILDWLGDHPGESPLRVADHLGLKPASVRQTMRRMADDGQLASDGDGHYRVQSSLSQLSPLSLIASSSDSSDGGDMASA